MEPMKSSDVVAKIVRRQTDVIFGVTGGVVVNIFDSLAKQGLKIINTHHQQSAAIAADAYSRLSNKLGVCVATSGPGALNLISGVACSYFDSVPMLVITGQVVVNQLRPNKYIRQYGFQQTAICDIFNQVVKYSTLIKDKDSIVSQFKKAISISKSGRSGPTLVDFCDDMQRQPIIQNVDSYIPQQRPKVSNQDIDKIIRLLKNAKRPVVIAGGGIKSFGRDCRLQFKRLIRKWKIPTALTWATLDILDDKDRYNIRDFGISSQRGSNIAIQQSDLLLVFGSRLDTHEVGANSKTFAIGAKKVVIDIDRAQLDKGNYDLAINRQVKDVINKLYQRCDDFNFSNWNDKIQYVRLKYPICLDEYYQQKDKINSYVFFNEISKVAKNDSIIITDRGATLTWTMQGWKIKQGQKLITAYNHSPMGYSLPAAIGASFACPQKDIICIIGDGGLQMNIQQLNTIVHHKLPIKIFVMNNHGYGIMKQTQDTWLNSRYVITQGPFPDILRVAQAYDLPVFQLNNHNELSILKDILQLKGPCLISVQLKKDQKIAPKLTFGSSIQNPQPAISEEQLKLAKEFLRS